MTEAPSLDAALARYDQALTQLASSAPDVQTSIAERGLEALLARDAVQIVLDEAKMLSSQSLLRLHQLDDRLKQQLDDRFKTQKQPHLSKQAIKNRRELYQTIAHWRELRNPPDASWWWQLEPPALFPLLEKRWGWLDRLDWFWTFLTLFFLTVSVTFILNTLNRILAGGIEAQGIFAVVLQTVLTLAGGIAALTQQGRQTLAALLMRCRIPQHHWQKFSALVALLFLLIVIGIHQLYLPWLAADLYRQGTAHYSDGRLDSALSSYQQSIALRPDYAAAHYHLGLLYENVQKLDEAITQYQLVVQSDANDLELLTVYEHTTISDDCISLKETIEQPGHLWRKD